MSGIWFTDKQWDAKKQSIDQAAHFAAGAVLLLPVLMIENIILGAGMSGLLIGVVREVEQLINSDQHTLHIFDRTLDAIFYGVGGTVMGVVAYFFF